MKYPQLVSTRAVNAISDWLVSRLEQLGVEAPQIYTRLLLSLLQSTIQLNDPIEFSNLESFFASRKGGNRRYLDTDALKKFNAVQCLKDIVSSEQEIATIENLVDELCEKLKDIDKQTGDSEDEDKQLVATLSLAHQQHHKQTHHRHGHHSNKTHHNHHQAKEGPTHSKSCSASSRGEGERLLQALSAGVAGSIADNNATAEHLEDSELDPSDLYFRAFPALSKEMEDSFVTWRRNIKWLTWPVEKHNQDQSISTSSSSSTISSNSAAEVATSSITQTNAGDKRMNDTFENAPKMPRQELYDDADDNEASAFVSANSTIGGGIKRKSKRRRSRALSKSKAIQQNTRKNLSGSISCGATSTSMQNKGNNPSTAGGAGRNKRSASPTFWDTDFEGCWEMGRDLIKEFITRQNRNSRNRSTSESAVQYNKKSTREVAAIPNDAAVVCPNTNNEGAISVAKKLEDKEHTATQDIDIESDEIRPQKPTTPVLPAVDISFCDYDDYDDTLATVSELTNDDPLLTLSTAEGAAAPAKRLYERELVSKDEKSDDKSDFAQFEAKFNSSVKALWKDAGNDEEVVKPIDNAMHIFSFGNSSNTHFSGGPNSLPFDVPLSQNVKNFWANYYNHHFDLSQMLPTSVIGEKAKELNAVMQSKANEMSVSALKPNGGILSCVDAPEKSKNFFKAKDDTSSTAPTTSDYYSMPSNLENLTKLKLQQHCGFLHHSGGAGIGGGGGGTIGEERKTPVAIFLQNSIWSENANIGGGDTDESFFFKVHNSGKQLNQYVESVGNSNNREEKLQSDTSDANGLNIGSGSGNNFGFTATYTTSKWSEGINAGPPQNNMTAMIPTQQLPQKQCAAGQKTNFHISLSALSATDCTDSPSSVTQRQPTKGTIKSDMQNAWATTSAPPSHPNATLRPNAYETVIVSKPKVTLANHSPRNSGFVEFARIKTVSQLQMSSEENASNASLVKRNYPPQTNNKEQQQQRYALDIMDDGENLLTSERTHFHPIKSYVDGHTFEICSELDVIEYERSASGYLYLEQDKYLEYTRTDNFMAEDDGGVGASANPLYANSNCEAARANANAHCKNGNLQTKRIERDFVIKFRVQRTEIACQTDIEPPTIARANSSANKHYNSMSLTATTTSQSHPLSLIFSNAAKNLKASASNELVYSDTADAFTRAMAHFPPPPPTTNNSTWLPLGGDNRNWNIYQQQSKVHKNNKKKISNNMKCNANDYDIDDDLNANADAGCDEVDFYGSAADVTEMNPRNTLAFIDTDVDMTSLEQQWSMNEIRKKCKEAGHMATYVNTNNNTDGGAGEASDIGIESVWGMCAACNSEMKSIPANRLLRDELQVEADEIMSDLRYMQDLYIGRAGDTDDADDEDEDDDCAGNDSGADTVTSDSDWCAEDTNAVVVEECSVKPVPNKELTDNQQDAKAANDASDGAITNDSDTFTVIQKVNRLIAELLRPDNNNDMEKLNGNADLRSEAEKETRTTQFSGNLWHSNRNERNIWQLNAADSTNGGIAVGAGMGVAKNSGGIHPIQLLRQFNVNPNEHATNVGNIFPLPAADDADKYHTQMSWEHENLARIWQTSSPPSQQPQKPHHQQPQQPEEISRALHTENSPAAAVNQSEINEETDIAEKNMRNLRADADASVEAAAANLQEAQEFLAHSQSEVIAFTSAQLVDSALKSKAVTRKRRHSASQNYFHAQLMNSGITPENTVAISNSIIDGTATLMQNNNNNDIANLNSYALKSSSLSTTSNANELSFQNLLNASLRFGAAAAAAVAASNAKKCSDYASNLCGADMVYGCDATAAAARNHTIITCKYHLTAIEPMAMHNDGGIDDNDDVGLFSGSHGSGITGAPLSCLIDKNQSILKHVTMVSRPLTR